MNPKGPTHTEVVLLEVLLERHGALADHWHGHLQKIALKGSRPFAETPADVPDVRAILGWILRSAANANDASRHDGTRSFEQMMRSHQAQGLGPGDLARVLRALEGLLYEELRSESGRATPGGASDADLYGAWLRIHAAVSVIHDAVLSRYTREETASPSQDRRRSEAFIDTLGHELRGPLHTALLSAELLRARTSAPSATEASALEQLQRSLRRIEEMYVSVRELSLRRRPLEGDSQRRSLREFFDVLSAELRGLADDRGVALEFRRPEVDVWVDASRVDVILRNLVENAIKYADVRKRQRWVEVNTVLEADVGALEIRVSDNGLGIAETDLDKIFARSFRGDSAPEGSGFGLAIAHEAADQMGARILVESAVGGGSRFTLWLPHAAWRFATGGAHVPQP